ncbi:unnamed protein product [Rhizophagus irregularis]|uniref:Ion transport domain-containing protein n=1 Tax=Rhizophagus irregularis TaxID=588596 RepID=A0A915ZV77_9GLOM|nr:unnamed protein product [Rhizophagus irregularis]CAB5389517.1 unnamed protein product [Rhizophagus irregularis]
MDGNHTIYHDKEFNPIVIDKEPWVIDEYERNSYCLYQKKGERIQTLQLIVGRSTVQIWHQVCDDSKSKDELSKLPNKGGPFLEYIWANDISDDFYLKVYWYERVSNVDNKGKTEEEIIDMEDKEIEKMERNRKAGEEMAKNGIMEMKEKIIQKKDIIEKANAVRRACRALEHLNKRRSFLVTDLLKYINLGLEDNERPENDMELAIYRYKGRELKDTVVVAYLLEYYSSHATDYAGWMSTVSKALPLLFKYNYDDYARKLFRKECFANQDYFSTQDPYNIIPVEYQAKRNRNIKFRAFRIDKLQSDEYEWYNRITRKLFDPFKKMRKLIEDFDNYLEKSPLALRVVPLPEFTISRTPQKNRFNIASNIFLFLFIPRWYKISRDEKNLLSSFSRVVRYENNDDMYDNPATEAVIDFRWQQARNFFFFLFIRFLVFAFCFIFISWEYLNHEVISWKFRNFLFALILIFYYLATYLLATEVIQLCFHGPRKYFGDIFNSFDICSILLPMIVMSIMLRHFKFSDGFASVESVDMGLMVGTSFSIFILWVEFVLYLRLISKIAIYIYCVIYIIKNIFPFILFMFIVIMGFAHTMFILLKNPNDPKIKVKSDTLSGAVTNIINNETLFNITLESDYDVVDRNDNPFSSFSTAITAAYFWLNGDMIQRDRFDFWVIDLFTLIASIFIVTVLQNMLIAFMSGVYVKAETKGRQALLRFRANQIADYEALEHFHFWPNEPEPKFIHYIGQSKNFQEWFQLRKDDQGEIYKDFDEKTTNTIQAFIDVDYDESSIWNFDDNNSSNIKGKKKDSTTALPKETIPSNSSENS